jgi:hypothetical protein
VKRIKIEKEYYTFAFDLEALINMSYPLNEVEKQKIADKLQEAYDELRDALGVR